MSANKNPETRFSRYFAEEAFNACMKSGIVAAAWYGAIFATRRVFKYTPTRPTFTHWVNRNNVMIPELAPDLTIPEVIGIVPTITSMFFGIGGVAFYISYRIDLAKYRYQMKQRAERD